jgi:hypothetical protein
MHRPTSRHVRTVVKILALVAIVPGCSSATIGSNSSTQAPTSPRPSFVAADRVAAGLGTQARPQAAAPIDR